MMNSNDKKLVDLHHRGVTYLRLSVTDRCNLNCCYCAPSRPALVKKKELLSLDEMVRISKIAVGLGIQKIRLTGGEPLCRPEIVTLTKTLANLDGIRDISLTTNGILLKEQAKALKQAGMHRINISLDTLDRNKFKKITGVDGFDKVWEGIMTAMDVGFSPIKINTVVMKGVNDDEIASLAALSLEYPVHVRFIEYMPIGTCAKGAGDFFLPVDEIKERVSSLGTLSPVISGKLDGPALRYRIDPNVESTTAEWAESVNIKSGATKGQVGLVKGLAGSPKGQTDSAKGEIGVIGSMSQHFCATCNRIRLTSNGFLRPCLLSDTQVDLMSTLRSGATDGQIERLFVKALHMKKSAHRLTFLEEDRLMTQMASIGG